MQEGDSNPERDSAASNGSMDDAIAAALAGMPDNDEPTAEANQAPESVAQDAETEEAVTDETQGQADPAPSQEDQLDAPKSWPKDRQEAFKTLPDAAKRILLDRDREFSDGIRKKGEENADHRKRSDALVEVLKPFEQDLQSAGMDHVSAVKFMVQEREAFNRDPIGFFVDATRKANADLGGVIKTLIERSGLTQDQLFKGQQPAPGEQQTTEQDQSKEWVDPLEIELRSTKSALDESNAKLNSLEQKFNDFFQTQEQRERLTVHEQIQAFATAADENGNPLRPHYEDLKRHIGWLADTHPEISAIPDSKLQEKLQKAYDLAVRMDDRTFSAQIDNTVNTRLSEELSKATVDKAKAAAPRRGGPGSNAPVTKGKMSMDESIEAAMREAGLA